MAISQSPYWHWLEHWTCMQQGGKEFLEMCDGIYHTATESAVESILERGILPPLKVYNLIRKGILDDLVLGYSRSEEHLFEQLAPYWVSLEVECDKLIYTPEMLFYRGKRPAVFKINPEIKNHRTLPFCVHKTIISPAEYGYNWNLWYRGIIQPRHIEAYGLLKPETEEDSNAWSCLESYDFHSL